MPAIHGICRFFCLKTRQKPQNSTFGVGQLHKWTLQIPPLELKNAPLELKILLLGGCFCFRQSFTFTNNEKKWFLV
jgi:hypothetical protein